MIITCPTIIITTMTIIVIKTMMITCPTPFQGCTRQQREEPNTASSLTIMMIMMTMKMTLMITIKTWESCPSKIRATDRLAPQRLSSQHCMYTIKYSMAQLTQRRQNTRRHRWLRIHWGAENLTQKLHRCSENLWKIFKTGFFKDPSKKVLKLAVILLPWMVWSTYSGHHLVRFPNTLV